MLMNFHTFDFSAVYAAPKCYFDSKLCQVLFTKQLEKRLQQEKANLHVYAVHPGAIVTDLWNDAGLLHRGLSGIFKPFLPVITNKDLSSMIN